jgi:hypothetical protein
MLHMLPREMSARTRLSRSFALPGWGIPRLFGALCALVLCVHQAQAAAAATNESGVQLTIELRDGSRVVGKSVEDTLSFHSAALGDMKLAWADIRLIEFAATNTSAARLTATNGDAFAITLAAESLRVETGFGQTELPEKLIRSVKVAPPAAAAVAAGTGAAQLAIVLRDGSHVVGKGLDDSLGFHSSAMGDLRLTWAGIRSIEFSGTNTDTARLTATNGDVYEVQFAVATVRVETSFGKSELPVKLIRRIQTVVTGNVTHNLIGWWKLDDGSGTVAKDSSGNAHDGTLINGPVWTRISGRDEVCLQFNDANGNGNLGAMPTPRASPRGDPVGRTVASPNGAQYVALGNILQGSYTELSIACWVKHPSSGWQNIVERGNWDSPDGIGLMMDFQGRTAVFGFYQAPNTVKSKVNVQDDQWHHLVGTLSKGESGLIYRIYVDGKLDNTETGPATGLAATSSPWAIGARYDGTYAYRGLLEDVRIYDCALSPSEVQAIYEERNHGEPLPPSSSQPRSINLSDSIQIPKIIN